MTKPFKMDLLCSIVLERIVPVMMVGGAWKGKGAGKREGLVQTWVFACRGGWKKRKNVSSPVHLTLSPLVLKLLLFLSPSYYFTSSKESLA